MILTTKFSGAPVAGQRRKKDCAAAEIAYSKIH